jgi:hypothetical protein
MSTLAVTEITAACNRDYKPARQRQSRSIVLSEGNRRRFPLRLNRSLHREVLNALYFVDTLLIATTSRTTISAPITVQIHIPPLIHPYAWFIIEPLPFGYDQAIPPDLAREEYGFSSGRSWRCAVYPNATDRAECVRVFGFSCSNRGRSSPFPRTCPGIAPD